MKAATAPIRSTPGAEQQLKGFIGKFEPEHQRLIRTVLKAARRDRLTGGLVAPLTPWNKLHDVIDENHGSTGLSLPPTLSRPDSYPGTGAFQAIHSDRDFSGSNRNRRVDRRGGAAVIFDQ